MQGTEDPAGRSVLVVEDEPKLARLLLDYLASEGYRAHSLGGGLEVVPWFKRHAPDLILLDLMLPGRGGLEVCQDLRAFSDVPIIMLTARIEEVDRLLGLDLGADDYVCKPYSPREVMARIRAVFRRLDRQSASQPSDNGLSLDAQRLSALMHGRSVELTATEFRLIDLLASHPGRVYSRNRLLDALHEDGRDINDRTIDSHVKNIRRKLSHIEPDRDLLVSVYGVGYKLEP